MQELKDWANTNGMFTKSAVILGIAQDNPEIIPPEKCRYDVCIVVRDDYEIADVNVNEATLPGGKYAVFMIDHTTEAVQKAWREIFTQLSAQGQQPDFSRPILERYIPAMVEKNICEICVPI